VLGLGARAAASGSLLSGSPNPHEAMYKATTKPTGLVNNVKVKCRKCGANLFVNPNYSKGGWQCPACNRQH
jgi:rubrerythrin